MKYKTLLWHYKQITINFNFCHNKWLKQFYSSIISKRRRWRGRVGKINILFISFRSSNGESSIARETFFFIQKLLNSGGDKLNSEFHIYKLQQRNAFFQVVCLMERYDDDFVSGNENEGTMFQVLKFFYLFICLTNEILINQRLK